MSGSGDDLLYMGVGTSYGCGEGTDYRYQFNDDSDTWNPAQLC
jgi:hypothetical protein